MPVLPPRARSPRGPDPAVNDELAAAWAQVQGRVVQLACECAQEVDPNLDIDGVLAQLDRAQRSRATSASKYASIRTTFDNTLQIIQSLSRVVAIGTNVIFAPSRAIYNAYLRRLEYYIRGGMDAKLAMVACQHLRLFVEVCDEAIKLRRKRHRLAVFTRVFFLSESAIDDLLKKMEGLLDNEGHLVSAQTFEFASGAASNSGENLAINRGMNDKMDVLVGDSTDRWKKETILRALAFDDDKIDWRKKEPDAYWLTAYHNYRNLAIQGTGQWIFGEPEFIAWLAIPPGTRRILAVEGTEGSGKSFLASAIIRRLRRTGASGSPGPRGLVAFYFLEGDPKEQLKNADNLGVIVKSLVWQLAQENASYLKSVVKICQEAKDLDPHEITTRLLLENETLATIDARIFIVIEGVDDIGAPLVKFLQRVSALPPDRDIRVLLTGRPRGINPLMVVEDISFEAIQISARNRPDVEKYIQFKMDRIDALKDTTRLGVAGLREKISDTLCDKTEGDYFKMDTILKQIRGLDYVHDIDRVLDNAGKERSQHVLGEIERLNDTRTPKEIGEINEIILWILYGRQWLSPKQMSAVLYVKSGELSLLSLDAKFQAKYSLFEVDSDGDVDFRSSETAELIPERHRDDDQGASGATVQHSEVTIIKHFLSTVCPPDIYAKFAFDDFFDRKLNHKTSYICRDDKDTSEAKLAVTCLRILTEERDTRRERLRPYAMNYFLQHLSAADLAVAGREWKRAVGLRLLKLFSDEQSIDALFWSPCQDEDEIVFGYRIRSTWIESNNAVDVVLSWLKDSTVISQISDGAARAWIADVISNVRPAEHLLEPVAKRMAVHWLQESSPVAMERHAFFFILGFLSKRESYKGVVEGENYELVPSLDKVYEIEEWAQSALGVKAKDAMWEVQMGSLQDDFCYAADAEKRYRHALELEPYNCRATYNLATMLESADEAIALLKPESERCEAGDEWLVEQKGLLADILFELGRRYWAKKKYDLAVESYRRSIDADVTGYKRALQVMEQYQAEQRWPDVEGVLEIIQKGSERVKNNLAEMVVELAESEPLHDMLLHAMSKTGRLGVLEMVYDEAIELATKDRAFDKLFYIRYYYAAFLNQRPENEERAVALWESALKDELLRSSLNMESTLSKLTAKLGPIYLDRARNAGREAEAQTSLDKIAALIPDEAVESKITLPASLYLARYHHVKGAETTARHAARSTVKLALELVSDNDESSDFAEFWKLLLVFLSFDDDANALTASVMASRMNRVRYTSSTSTRETDGATRNSRYQYHYLPLADCGGCGRYLGPGSVMWWCKDCIDMAFDGACFQKLKQGSLPRRICSRGHSFLAVPGWDAKRLGELHGGVLPYGEKMVSFEAWKRVVREKYVDLGLLGSSR
ncbi:hypothetical protein PHISP_01709 [Aspergillus sp. HF37]|nr:hypothetical protein PHISP_01709 [Aspergillus sp. HF37]